MPAACGSCGFSTKDTSIAWFDSAWVEIVLMLAMCASGIHFGLIFATLTRQRNNIFRSEVVRVYAAIIAVATLCIGASLFLTDTYDNLFTALRQSVFQVVSLITTTGFATANTNLWTPFAIVILIILSIICGCAGSTSGGVKVDRVLLFGKVLKLLLLFQFLPLIYLSCLFSISYLNPLTY
mgnify:CR=1 FL=1